MDCPVKILIKACELGAVIHFLYEETLRYYSTVIVIDMDNSFVFHMQ